MIRSAIMSPVNRLIRPAFEGVGSSIAAQIRAQFAAGEQGVWFETSLTNGTLFQDNEGTVPATAYGQTVRRMLDKSGRGNHITFIDVVVRQDVNGLACLGFNGVSSYGVTAAIDFTGTDKMMLVAGVRKLSDSVGMPLEFSAVSDSNAGTFAYLTGNGGPNTTFRLRGSTPFTGRSFATPASPASFVDSVNFDISKATSATEIAVRSGGASPQTSIAGAADAGGGNFGSYPLYMGARAGASLFLNGQVYGLIIRGALSSDTQIASAERFMAGKTGVVL